MPDKKPEMFFLSEDNGRVCLRVFVDGSVEYGEGVTPTYAAQLFWNAMQAEMLRRYVNVADAEQLAKDRLDAARYRWVKANLPRSETSPEALDRAADEGLK